MSARSDLQGRRFHRLTVKEYVGEGCWLCVCDCGVEKVFIGGNLKRGLSKSCGCYHVERQSEIASVGGKTGSAVRFPPELKDERRKAALSRKRINSGIRRRERPDVVSAEKKRCYEAKKEEYKARIRRNYNADPAKKISYQAEYAKRNSEKIRAYMKLYTKAYIERHPEYRRFKSATYRAWLLKATPGWADLGKIREIYAEAKFITDSTEIEYEVDHIIPLRGKTVCGLHVESNLRVITAEENLLKSAKLVEELL